MISERISQVRAQWERLSMRERRLLTLLGACFLALAVFGIGYVINDGLQDIEERNQAIRVALKDIASKRDDFLRARSEIQRWEVKIPPEGQAQPLQGYLESAAKQLEITIPEMKELPPQSQGRRFIEKSVDIKLRGVNLLQLADFLQKVETSSTNIVIVSRLYIRTRFNQHEQLDAEITVSTFERAAVEKTKGPSKKGRRSSKKGRGGKK